MSLTRSHASPMSFANVFCNVFCQCLLPPAAEELIYGPEEMSTMQQRRLVDARRVVQARRGGLAWAAGAACLWHARSSGTALGAPEPFLQPLRRHATTRPFLPLLPHPFFPARRSWWSARR